MFRHILLCTHGTAGARKAEKWVFDHLALQGHAKTKVTVLTVINEDWKLMLGDDWLNTTRTHQQFLDHVGGQLATEIEADWDRIRAAFPSARGSKFMHVVGPVEETIAEVAEKLGCDLIVAGPYQKIPGKGFKARIQNKKLHPLLPAPLLTAM